MKRITFPDFAKNRTKVTKRWYGLLSLCMMLLVGQLGFAQTVQIGSGTATTVATDNTVPITNYNFSYAQMIITEAQITSGGGQIGEISKLRFYTTAIGTTSVWAGNWSVYLGNTTKTEFSSTTDWVALANLVNVYTGSVSPIANNWWEISFTTPFNYTGGNLVVAIDENTPGWSGVPTFRTFSSGSNTGLYYRTDNTANNPDPANPPLVATGGALGRTATLPQMQLYFTEPCAYPETLTAVNITQNSADLGWSSDGDLFDVEWGTTGFTPTGEPNGTNETGITSNSLTLNGLSASTSYQFYVRQNCGAIDGLSSWSGPFTFITACNLPDAPTEITFTSITTTGTTVNYVAPSVAPTGYVVFRSTSSVPPVLTNGTTYTTNNTTAIASLTSGSNTYFCVYNGTALSGAITGLTSNTQYYYHVFSRSSENSCSGAPWYSTSALSGSQATAPAAPTTPVVSDITTDEATISWTASVVGGEAGVISYIIEVYTDNGYTTAITGSPFNVGTVLTYDFTDLDHSTQYYYRVKANNTFADSSYLTGNFTTLCAPEVAPTTIQTFSSYTGAAPATLPCWSEATGTLDAALTGTTSTWQNQAYNSNYPAGTTTNGTAAYINLYGADNEWLISNSIDLGDGTTAFQLEYDVSITPWTGTANVTAMGEKFVKVVVSTDNGATWTTANVIKTYDNNDIPGNGGRSEIIALTGYSGIIKIAFYAHSTANTNDTRFYIDNFKIDEVPECPLPTLVNVSATTHNSTTIGWTSDGSLFDIEIIEEGETPTGTPTYPEVTSPFTTTAPLIPATSYDVYVRQNCGVDGTSTWVGPLTFTTECLPPSITGTTPGEVCGQGEVELSATADAGATISWYSAETGGTKLDEGAMFTTPLITETTSYWVSASTGTDETGGRLAYTTNDGTTASTYGIRFTANESFTLNSTVVYLRGSAGDLVVNLTNGSGAMLQTRTIALPAGNATTPIAHTIDLDFVIDTPGDYRLIAVSGPNMVRETAIPSSSYPMNIGSAVTLTAGDLSGTAYNTYYYYFYSWNISTGCASARTEVIATVTNAADLELSSYDVTICDDEQNTAITITTGDEDYDIFTWSVPSEVSGDVNTGWTFTPTESTTYTLTATNSVDGCVTTKEVTVTVGQSPDLTISDEVEVCADTIIALNSGVVSYQEFINETFTGSTTFPSGWNTVVGAGDAVAVVNANTAGGDANQIRITGNSQFTNVTNRAYYGPINTSGLSELHLQWNNYVNHYSSGYNYSVRIQTSSDGVTWNDTDWVTNPVTTTQAAGVVNTTITTSDVGSSTFYVSFTAQGQTFGMHNWNIDNVILSGEGNGETIWSPITNLYTDSDATIPYVENTGANVVYFKGDAGSYSYDVTATSDIGCESTATVEVTVNESPDAPTATSPQSMTEGDTVADIEIDGQNLTWYTDASLTTEIEDSFILNEELYTFYVTQTVDGCVSEAAIVVVEVTLSSKGFDMTSFKAYPNPVKDFFNVSYSKNISNISVINMLGQTVISKTVNSTDTQIDMTSLPTGNYFVKVNVDGAIQTVKVIKQ